MAAHGRLRPYGRGSALGSPSRGSFDEIHGRCHRTVQSGSCFRVRPRGFFPDAAFGREPSHSTGGTRTRVDSRFTGARRIYADKPGTARHWRAVLGLPAGRQSACRALQPLAATVTVQGLKSLGQEVVAEPATTTREPRVVPSQLHSYGKGSAPGQTCPRSNFCDRGVAEDHRAHSRCGYAADKWPSLPGDARGVGFVNPGSPAQVS
jgi:hypothetical protein